MTHPVKTAMISISGLDDSIIMIAVVIRAVAASGGSKEADISASVIRRKIPIWGQDRLWGQSDFGARRLRLGS